MEATATAPPERRTLFTRISRGIVIFLCAFAILFALIESVLRIVDIPGLTYDDLMPHFLDDSKTRTQGHPYMAYVERPNWDTKIENYKDNPSKFQKVHHNSLGFRGPETTWEKPPGFYRIVCVGGSSTYGHTESADETTWPARLQHHLSEMRKDMKFECINLGATGWSTFESLINLELRGIDFRPDLVIYYEGINDSKCAIYPTPTNDNTHWRAIWPTFRTSLVEKSLEKSYTYLIWRKYCTDYIKERSLLDFNAIVGLGKGDPYYRSNPPEQGFKNFQRNLVSMIAVARAHGAGIVFATQAMRFSDIAGAESRECQTYAIERMKQIIRDVAAERGVPLIDAAPVLESAAAEMVAAGKPDTIFGHEVHLLDGGSDLLAKTLAEGIIAQKVLP